MIPRDYQEVQSTFALKILQKYLLVYLNWEERTGKSLTAILIVEKSLVQRCLIITKKKAIGNIDIKKYDKDKEGWADTLRAYKYNKHYDLTTFGKAHNYNPDNYDIIIIDEAHNFISGYPKPSSTHIKIAKLTKGKPIILLSATPHAQGRQLMYHQFSLSSWSPWRNYSTFYNWFKNYGKPYTIKAQGRDVNQYDRVNDDLVEASMSHLFISKTRKELGFTHEPKDKKHYIELSENTKKLYNKLMKDKVIKVGRIKILADTVIKERFSLHMIEGGTIKVTLNTQCILEANTIKEAEIVKVVREKIGDLHLCHVYYILPNNEKIQYILDTWGDTSDIAIMYNYIAEEYKLKQVFKHAAILQATSNAEGVELSQYEHLIVYSQDWSTARHTQRRARQASKDREFPIIVNFLLTKKGISEQCYKTVAINKQNFVDSRYNRILL